MKTNSTGRGKGCVLEIMRQPFNQISRKTVVFTKKNFLYFHFVGKIFRFPVFRGKRDFDPLHIWHVILDRNH